MMENVYINKKTDGWRTYVDWHFRHDSFSKSKSSWDLEQLIIFELHVVTIHYSGKKCRHNFHDSSEIVPPLFEVISILFKLDFFHQGETSPQDLTLRTTYIIQSHIPGADNHHHQLAHPQRAHSRCHGLRSQMLHQALNPLGFCSCRSSATTRCYRYILYVEHTRNLSWRGSRKTGWWFQPIWKIIVKMGIFPK